MTIIVDDLRKAIDIMFNPRKETAKTPSLQDAFAYYYKATVIPLILFILIAALFVLALGAALSSVIGSLGGIISGIGSITGLHTPSASSLSTILPTSHLVGTAIVTFGLFAVIAYPILLLWIVVPIGMIVAAAFYYVVGGFLGTAKRNYSTQLAAYIYGISPLIAFFWLLPILLLGHIVAIILAVWSLVVLIVALSNANKVKRLETLLTLVFSELFALVVIAVLAAIILSLAVIPLL